MILVFVLFFKLYGSMKPYETCDLTIHNPASGSLIWNQNTHTHTRYEEILRLEKKEEFWRAGRKLTCTYVARAKNNDMKMLHSRQIKTSHVCILPTSPIVFGPSRTRDWGRDGKSNEAGFYFDLIWTKMQELIPPKEHWCQDSHYGAEFLLPLFKIIKGNRVWCIETWQII